MALVKDLIVQGNARFLNDAFFAIIKSGTWNGSPIDLTHGGTAGETTAGKVLVSTATSGTSEWKLQSALSVGSATTATTATYASNVGASGTAGTNYVTAAKVIATCNWYDTMTGSDTDTVINRWSEIVAFVANFTETPDLATFLSNNYLAKSGGTMTGPIKWTDATALPSNSSPQYFLCIDTFASGGTTKYATKADTLKALTGLTSTAIGDADEPVYWDGSKFVKAGAYPTKASWNYDDRYLKLSSTEQTVESTISSFSKGIVEFYRSSGDHIAFITFSNKANNAKRVLGSIGFYSGGVGKLQYRSADAKYYDIINGSNITTYIVGTASTTLSTSEQTLLTIKSGESGSLSSTTIKVKLPETNPYPSYIGKTAVQTTSAEQDVDGIGKLNVKGLGKDRFILHPVDGEYYEHASPVTGYLKITLPNGYNRALMIRFNVDIYDYYADRSCSYYICGYIYTDAQWLATTAYSLSGNGSAFGNLPVKFGHDGTKAVVWIGNADTEWNYPHVVITNVMGSFNDTNSGYSKLISGWVISFDTSEPTNVTVTKTNSGYTYGAHRLAGGNAGSIPYQTGAGTTAMLAGSGTNGYILSYNTSTGAPQWVSPGGTHNHDDTYLKLTGGTLTSSSNPTLNIKSTASGTSEVGIRFYRNTTEKAWIGYHDTYGVYLYNKARGKYLNYKDDGTLQFEGNTVWHAGNDGADSGLDADLLDGKHASDFATNDHNHDTSYVKLDAGAAEQTIKNSIGNISNGSIEIWRATSGGYPMIGFATGTTKTKLGFLGFGATANEPLFRNTSGTDYKLLHSGNYTTYTVKKDGTGASGTWGISITGSAGSVAWANVSDRPDWITWTDQTSTASYSLSNGGWTQTINLPTTKGSYILQLSTGSGNTESYLTGMFSISGGDTAKDEISLHLHGKGKRLYARTNGTKLELSSNDATATSVSVTIKYRRMI